MSDTKKRLNAMKYAVEAGVTLDVNGTKDLDRDFSEIGDETVYASLPDKDGEVMKALKDSRNIMNTLGMIMTDENYSKAEKIKRIEFMMEVHMNDVFLRVEDLLKEKG